jgi:uracil-DNA glycosylase
MAGDAIPPGTESLCLIRSRIQFHRAMGIAGYPRNAGVRRFMELTGPESGAAPAGREKAAGNALADSARTESAGTFLQALRQEVLSCSRCRLGSDRLGCVAGRGGIGCRLMVVGDWSSQEDRFSDELLFGPEEDVMLWKMMAAIGLEPREVYATNCIKCCPGREKGPARDCETICFSFVSREIALLKPMVICAMGDIAARMLTGRKDPLFRLRGHFLDYRHDSAVSAAVMPTFHPRFLLRNPEMKKAAWNDLQTIKRRLEGKKG